MALTIKQQLTNLGMPPQAAVEIVRQIDAKVGDARRIMAVGISRPLAVELARQINAAGNGGATDTPPVIAGLIADWNPNDAASLTLEGSLITTLGDGMASGYDLTGTGAARPTLVTVGGDKNIARFSGAQQMTNAALAAAWPDGYTVVFIAGHGTIGSTSMSLFDVGLSTSITLRDRVLVFNGTNGMQHRKANATGAVDRQQQDAPIGTTNNNKTRCWFFSSLAGAAGPRVKVADDVEVVGPPLTLAFGFDTLTVGNRASTSGNSFWTGDLYRLLVYSANLADQQKTDIATWASTLYGAV